VRRERVGTTLVMVADTEPAYRPPPGSGNEPLLPPEGADLVADVRVPDDYDAFGYTYQWMPRPTRLRVFLLDRTEALDWSTEEELGP
jgi:hypothetical protein